MVFQRLLWQWISRRFPMTGMALAFSLLSLFVACAKSPDRPEEIRVGFIVPLTGPLKGDGQRYIMGAKLAVEQVNQRGGLKVGQQQRKITLLIEDDKDNPDEAVAAANKLINQQNVVALLGIPISRNAIPVAEVAENAQIPMITSGSTNPATTQGKKFVFRTVFIDPFQGRVMAAFALKNLSFKRAAVLYEVSSPYSQGVADFFKEFYSQNGGKIVAFETYTADTNQNFQKQLKTIRDRQPQVLFLPNIFNDVKIQAQQSREQGIKVPMIGSDTWDVPELFSVKELQTGFYSTYYDINIKTPENLAFIKDFQQTFNQNPGNVEASTYDAFGLLFQAIKSQGSSDPLAIQKGLSGIKNYAGVSGILEYRGTGDPIRSAVIKQIKDNKSVFYKQVNP